MRCLGEIRSPLEASVQELCNARLVEVICTWTKASLQFLRMNSVYGPFPPGSRQSLTYLPLIWRNQTNSSRQGGSLIPTNPNFAEMTRPTGLRLSSFAATRRRYAEDFSLRYAQWESR